MSKRAVFLDRDQTIIADPGFIDDPDQVTLLPGAAESIRLLNDADLMVVVATNQSGVARGLVSEEQLGEIHERLREMLLELSLPERSASRGGAVSPGQRPAQAQTGDAAARRGRTGVELARVVDDR